MFITKNTLKMTTEEKGILYRNESKMSESKMLKESKSEKEKSRAFKK